MKITVNIHHGNLAEHSFPYLLHSVYMTREDGVLTLENMGRTKEIHFENGIPVYVNTNVSAEKLDHFLIDKEVLTAEEAQEGMRRSIETEKSLGELLITGGALEPFELYKYLRQIFARSILDIFRWETGEFTWRDGRELPETELRLKMNPAQLCLMGIENFTANESIAELFSPTETDEWILNPVSPYPLDNIKLNPKETKLFTLLKKSKTLGSLLRDSESEVPYLRKKLYTLELLEIILSPKLLRSQDQVQEEAPKKIEPKKVVQEGLDTQKVRQFVTAAFEQIKEANLFEFLFVAKDAKPEEIKNQFYEFAYWTNPVNLKKEDDAELKEQAEKVFLRAVEAYSTLGDALKRTNYLKIIDAPQRLPDGQPVVKEERKKKPGAAFAIKTDLLKGDQHLKNGLKALEARQFPKAKEHFEFALDVEPNAMHEAYVTYADFMMNPMRKYEDALERLEAAIKKEPDHEVPHYLMAHTYREMGDANAAIRKLKDVIRLNPGHVSANREIVMIRKEADEKKNKKKRFFR